MTDYPRLHNHPIRQLGFTLVEILIVLGILAIIVAIAYPFYTQYQIRAERSDATTALLGAWNELERCFVDELNYAACEDKIPAYSPREHYALDAELSETSFTLYAHPAADSSQEADDECQQFTLDHHGQRGSSPASVATCWDM